MTILNVGMGEIQVSNNPVDIITAPGLGSCIGLSIYDPVAKIAGMAHIVLPDSNNSSTISLKTSLPGKFADTAVPEVLNQMYKLGAKKQNLIIKISGGAQMFNFEKGGNVLNIGMRNAIAVKSHIAKEGLTIKTTDTGGNKGRTVKIEVKTGTVCVKIIGQQEVII